MAGQKTITIIILLPCLLLAQIPIKLGWDANKEPDLAGYRVHFGQGEFTHTVEAGRDTIFTVMVPNFDINTLYQFAVTAFDKSGNESDFSNVIRLHRCDFNADSVIDGRDNILINRVFGVVYGDSLFNFRYDLNADSIIDGRDKLKFNKHFGKNYE